MKKIKNSKGFTLMEMLIVVAIIAVLVAIAIPTFTTSLNKARVATDEANIRSGYAAVMADVLTNQISTESTVEGKTDNATDMTYTLLVDGTVKREGAGSTTQTYATKGKLSNSVAANGVNIAGYTFTAWDKNQTVTYEYKGDSNTVTIKVGETAGTKTTQDQ